MEDEKLSGRVVIDTILLNMRQQVEELRYSKIVPATYDVYLHAVDFQRLESLSREIVAEATRALQEALDVMNRPSRLDRVRDAVKRPRLPIKKVGPWLVRIDRDHDGKIPRGRALVVSQIALSGADHYEGPRTRRLSTMSPENGAVSPASEGRGRVGADEPRSAAVTASALASEAPAKAADPEPHAAAIGDTRPKVLATLTWHDESGSHVHRMDKPQILVGRETPDSGADIRLRTVPDVSRNHFRIRFDALHGRFSAEDLSLLGTTVNGRAIIRGVEHPLPASAEIRLANAVTIRFESEVRE